MGIPRSKHSKRSTKIQTNRNRKKIEKKGQKLSANSSKPFRIFSALEFKQMQQISRKHYLITFMYDQTETSEKPPID